MRNLVYWFSLILFQYMCIGRTNNMVLVTVLLFTYTFYVCAFSLDPCENHKTCNKCITDPNNCIWCAKENMNEIRCKSMFETGWCADHQINPVSSINKTEDKAFSSDLGKSVQIRPQKYKIDLRVGETINFTFSYEAAKNYPVDIYFLVDASNSMEQIRLETADKSESIYSTMYHITNNVFLGFGTFIDKNAIPFASKIDSELSYSFKHRLSLTKEYMDLKRAMNKAPNGKSFDEPEGGLDALGQVMACSEEIGWRNQSRKIIVFLTDANYHAAGNGKLAGIVKPYDGKCYTEDGVYLNELNMDYPSVSVINKLARTGQFVVVFAVKQGLEVAYTKLKNAIHDSWSTTYNTDMADILKKIYKNITQTIKLDVKSAYRQKIEVKFDPDCFGTSEKCIVHKGQHDFTGTIKLLSDIDTNNFTVDIIVGGIEEKLTLDIDIIKKCDCRTEIMSEKCSLFGDRICGICECANNRFGEKCECSATSGNNDAGNSSCVANDDDKLCSGHGICHCGSCECNQRYNGRYCECDKNMCPKDSSNVICGGHGDCHCGVCACTSADWTGDACDCYKPNTPCIVNDKVCNNRGHCECGTCTCDFIADWDARFYQDQYCRVISNPESHNVQCDLLVSCAECYHSGVSNCSVCHPDIKVNTTRTLNDTDLDDESRAICYFKSNSLCYSHFAYTYDDDNYGIKVIVETDKQCAESYYMIGGIILVTLIIIGIATLVAWKLLTDARDRHEYEKFIKQRDEDITESRCNPYFKPSTTMFKNPAFGQARY